MAANLAASEAVIRAVLQHQHAYLFECVRRGRHSAGKLR